MIHTPVLFIIFNRPDVTGLVFNEIKKAQPKQLFIAADGPRANRPADLELCKETRAIVDQIDWPCEVKTLFREENLGCGHAVSSAITWFFDNVEEGIILEDDCLPHPTFFTYCQDLLEHYRNDPKVMHIGGVNFQNGNKRGNASYYFSGITHVWGWASWRRAWSLYNFNVSDFYTFVREEKIYNYFPNEKLGLHWLQNFKSMYYHQIDTWDHQWSYAVLNNGGLSIIPNTNLISNIGFREDATHTSSSNSVYANAKTSAIQVPLEHPYNVELNQEADYYFFNDVERLPIGETSFIYSSRIKLRTFLSGAAEYVLRNYVFASKFKNPSNTILIQKTDAVGDYIITRNFFKEVLQSEKYKGYHVYLLANIRLKTFIEETDKRLFKDVIYFDINDLKKLKTKYVFYYKVRKLKPHTIIHATFSRSVMSDEIVFHSGAKHTIGFSGDTSNISTENKAVTDTYYSQLIDVDKINENAYSHEFEKQKIFFETIVGKKLTNKMPDLTDVIKADTKQIISVCPGSHEAYKIWDPAYFAELINQLADKYPSYEFKVICGPNENIYGIKILNDLKREVSSKTEVINTTSILNLIEHLSKSALIVANDSAPVHVAVGLNIPNVCIFNGTKYARFVPYPEAVTNTCRCVLPPEFIKEMNASETKKQFYYKSISSHNINSIPVNDVFTACINLLPQ